MPIFRFHCRKCGKDAELLLPRYDSSATCPACGSSEMEKQLSVFAAVTKSGPASCAARHDCPAAGTHQCGGGCCCHGGH